LLEERVKMLEENNTRCTTTTEMQTFGARNADGRISTENKFGLFLDILYGRMHNEEQGNWTATTAEPNFQSVKANAHYVTFNKFLSIGLSYETYLADNTQQVGCSLGYESQFYSKVLSLPLPARTGIDLAVYGLTAKAWWEF
jgi:hypothetical protein